MPYSAITQPYYVMGTYSSVPLKLYDTDYTNFETYTYLANICWDSVIATASTAYSIGALIYTQLYFSTAHNFLVGEELLFEYSGVSNLSGYYNVIKNIDSNSVVINLINTETITGATVQKVLVKELPPDKDGYAKIDLGETLKDFVTENLEDSNYIFSGPDTKFCFDLKCGSAYYEDYFFDDLQVGSAFVNLVNTTGTTVSDVPFSIGDNVQISIEPIIWSYNHTFSFAGFVGYSGNTAHGTEQASIVNVTGQITYPSLNGPSNIIQFTSPDPYEIVTTKTWPGAIPSPNELGDIYIYPPLGFANATITNIFYSAGTGVILETNIPGSAFSWTASFGGKVTGINIKKKFNFNQLTISNICVYNARFEEHEYAIDAFDPFKCYNRTNISNYLSTILKDNTQQTYRIEKETKSWLLCHTSSGYINRFYYLFYDNTNDFIGFGYIPNTTSNNEDFYVPIGINQIAANTAFTNSLGAFSAYSGSIHHYDVAGYFSFLQATNNYSFILNDECSSYDVQHLMWKDKLGSWLSMTFKFKHYDNLETERRSFKQLDGNWDNDTYGYDSFGRGDKQYYTRSKESIIVNTGWLRRHEVELVKDLFKSAQVYHQDSDGNLKAVIINNKNITLINPDNDELIQYEFELIYARSDYRF